MDEARLDRREFSPLEITVTRLIRCDSCKYFDESLHSMASNSAEKSIETANDLL